MDDSGFTQLTKPDLNAELLAAFGFSDTEATNHIANRSRESSPFFLQPLQLPRPPQRTAPLQALPPVCGDQRIQADQRQRSG